MKLARFSRGGGPELGVVKDEAIVPLAQSPRLPRTMVGLIIAWEDVAEEVTRLVRESTVSLPLNQFGLLAPVQHPQKILAIGLNYADHIAETGAETPKEQIWFCKQPSAVNAPFAPIQIPKTSEATDYEAEMVVVIGRRARHVSKDDAPKMVFGYCVGNDMTARDWQRRSPQWMLGKSFDTHAPFGPWITTADEIADPHTLGIRCIVNGETRQDSNTANLVFNVWDQIAHVSKVMTLEPGDLLFTGTPGGVGMGMKPPLYLQTGDRVRVEIDRLGAIEAECVAER